MRSKRMMTICMMWSVASGAGVSALANALVNPYHEIAERNPFSLRPASVIEIEPIQAPLPPTPLATVEITGVTSIFGEPRALLEIVPGPGKPMIKPILGVGERADAIEVVSIDVDSAEVVIRNGSVLTNVPLKVAKAGELPIPPDLAPKSPLIRTSTSRSEQAMGGVPERRSVAVGGGIPVPERPVRIPRLPPVPAINRSTR